MKVLLVCGSPNKNGCVNKVLNIAKSEFEKENIKADIFYIGNKGIPGCTSCMYCKKN